MTTLYPSARSIRHALSVLKRMPFEALADLVEQLVDRLDAAEPDNDREEDNQDACSAGDDGGYMTAADRHLGDADDAEFSGDEHEPDEDSEDFPFGLRPERDGFVTVTRYPPVTPYRDGNPVDAQPKRRPRVIRT